MVSKGYPEMMFEAPAMDPTQMCVTAWSFSGKLQVPGADTATEADVEAPPSRCRVMVDGRVQS